MILIINFKFYPSIDRREQDEASKKNTEKAVGIST